MMHSKPHASIRLCLNALVCLSLVLGCSRKTPPVRQYQPPPPPPPVPVVRKVPLNADLRASAKTQIQSAFASSNPILRAHAVEAMQETTGRETAKEIISALDDRNELVRFAAALAVGQLGLVEAKPRLLQLAEDPDASVRIGAKFALHKLGDTRYSHDFEFTYRDPVKRTRGDTAMVLGLLGEKSASIILVPMMRDSDYTVRIQAAEALWRLGDDRGLQPLIGATISRFPDDQMVALLALAGPRDERASENFRGALTSDYAEVALISARCLGLLGSDEGYGVALKGAKSPDKRQRLLAAMAFGAIGRSDSQDVLRTLLQDPDPDTRLAAATAILQLRAPTS